jgi:hypothetical protein
MAKALPQTEMLALSRAGCQPPENPFTVTQFD